MKPGLFNRMLVIIMNRSVNPMSKVEFYPMEADGADYPEAMIPGLPPASCGGWLAREPVAAGSAFRNGGESFIQGRYALAEALRRAGAGAEKAVLLPAFHCRVMVETVLYLGAQPCFYPVSADLRPDFAALSRLVSEGEVPVAAMVLTHYFGFPNALDEAARFCAFHGIALIEDCAHAFYGRSGERLLGSVGSYAIASAWKFLPVRDGGQLRDNTGGKAIQHTAQPWLAEVKALAAILQVWGRRVRHRSPLPDIDVVALGKQSRLIAARSRVRTPNPGLKEFVPERVLMAALRSSRWGTSHAAHGRVARRRRINYLQWLEGMRSLPGVEPLFPYLPDGVVPYAFPLLVDAAGMGFHLLKLAGIPVLRWEDMAVTDCAISLDYRIRLLQLPCHQELRAEEMAWMIRTVQILSSQFDTCADR